MKHLPLTFFFLLISSLAWGQHVSLSGIQADSYPEMSAQFLALDARGRQIFDLKPSDLQLVENGRPVAVAAVQCPPAAEPLPLSVVLAIDVSGSMDGARVLMAQQAALAFARAAPMDLTEIALTSFDDRSYLNTDFTNSYERVAQAIVDLRARGGTNYQLGFLQGISGALETARRGRHKRVVVFLTDGLSEAAPEGIIRLAQELRATVYCLAIQMDVPPVLAQVAHATGGKVYGRVNDAEQGKRVYLEILQEAQGIRPCRVTWRATPNCRPEQRYTLTALGRSASLDFRLPDEKVPALQATPSQLSFLPGEPGTRQVLPVRLTARAMPFDLRAIRPSDPQMRVLQPERLPARLAPGQSLDLQVAFDPSQAGAFSRFLLENNLCPESYFYANTAGQAPTGTARSPLRVKHPNGGELFAVGTQTTIEWEGIGPGDPVALHYSDDLGRSWHPVATDTGLVYEWKLPPLPGERYLVRVDQVAQLSARPYAYERERFFSEILFGAEGKRMLTLSPHGRADLWNLRDGKSLAGSDAALRVAFAPSGRWAAVLGRDKALAVLDALSGDTLWHQAGTGLFAFSPTEDRVACTLSDKELALRQLASGQQLVIKTTKALARVEFSPDGTRLLTVDADGVAQVWDSRDGRELMRDKGREPLEQALFLAGGQRLVVARGQTLFFWDASSGALASEWTDAKKIEQLFASQDGRTLWAKTWEALWAFDPGTGEATLSADCPSFAVSADGRVAFAQVRKDSVAGLWDARAGRSLATLSHAGGQVQALAFSPDGGALLTGSSDYVHAPVGARQSIRPSDKIARIWDTRTGQMLAQMQGHTGAVTGGAFSPDGLLVATFSLDSTARVWDRTSGQPVVVLRGHQEPVLGAYFAPDGRTLVTLGSDNTAKAWDVLTGRLLKDLAGHSSDLLDAFFSPDNAFLVTRSFGMSIVWPELRQEVLQTDQSDGPFRLADSPLAVSPIDMGTIFVGQSLDRRIAGWLRNPNLLPAGVEAIEIRGGHAEDFSLATPFEPMVVAARSAADVEFRFRPKVAGQRSAQVWLMGPMDTLRVEIRGKAVSPSLRFEAVVDFGKRVPLFETDTLALRVSNSSSQPVRLDSVVNAGPNASQFRLLLPGGPVSIGSQQSLEIPVVFAPTVRGFSSGSFELWANGIDLPQTVQTFGEGVGQRAVEVAGRLTDQRDGRPLEAVVSVFDLETGRELAREEAEGQYSLSVNADRQYAVVVAKEGYLAVSESLDLRQPTQAATQALDVEVPPFAVGSRIVLNNVFFETGKAALDPASELELRRVAALLAEHPALRVEIGGHTDSVGTDAINLPLSQNRANAVRDYLLRQGVPASRLVAKGYAAAKPIAPNHTPEGRQRNRRVEFLILEL